jgi:hypothetical protein
VAEATIREEPARSRIRRAAADPTVPTRDARPSVEENVAVVREA